MKRILKHIFSGFCFLLSLIFNNFVGTICKKIKYGVCTANFHRKLKHHGKNITIKDRNLFEGLKYVSIGDDFSAQDGTWIGAYSEYGGEKYTPSIQIGNNVHFSRNCHIGAIQKVVIEDNVLLGSNVLINDHSHGETFDFSKPRHQLPLYSKGDILIGANTWIGDNAIILSGVHIGKNCVIGANAVVTKSFDEEGLVIAGNPARIVKRKDS